MMSEEVAPPVGEFVLVAGDVAAEGSAHYGGDAGPEFVALSADSCDGDGLGSQFAVDADVHLRGFRLVSHGAQPRSPRSPTATHGLPADLQVCRLARSHNYHLICTDPRSSLAATAGIRDTHLTEKDAPSSLRALVPPGNIRRLA